MRPPVCDSPPPSAGMGLKRDHRFQNHLAFLPKDQPGDVASLEKSADARGAIPGIARFAMDPPHRAALNFRPHSLLRQTAGKTRMRSVFLTVDVGLMNGNPDASTVPIAQETVV